MYPGLWTLFLPAPIFWGVIAAWVPIPPAVMAGILCGAMVYALLNHLFNLREWDVDDEPEPAWNSVQDEPVLASTAS